MKQIQFFLLVCFLMMGFQSEAQRREFNPEKMAEKRATKLQEALTAQELALDAEALAKVKAIHLKYAQQLKDVRSENRGDRTAMREAMESINIKQRKELKKALSKNQFKVYKKLEEEERAKREERRNNRGGAGRFGQS